MKVFIIQGSERHIDSVLEVRATEAEALQRGEELLDAWTSHWSEDRKKKVEWRRLGGGDTFIHYFSHGDDGPSVRIDQFDLKVSK